MSDSKIKESSVISIFGKKAGKKLISWLEPCCNTFCDDVRACSNNYKSYVAVLTQDNTNAPVVFQTFENTLEVTPTFNYDAVGNYSVLFDKPIFDSPWAYVTLSGSFGSVAVGAVPIFFDALSIQTADGGVAADNILGHYYPNILEIRVYNT